MFFFQLKAREAWVKPTEEDQVLNLLSGKYSQNLNINFFIKDYKSFLEEREILGNMFR